MTGPSPTSGAAPARDAATAWNPLVTALVPTYNGAEFIQRTLDSLAAQTWPNLEILIGDDRSTDDTLEVVRRFADRHPRTRIVERERNLGWLGNSNDLMGRAAGELQFFAFHDDIVAPTYVERLVAALAANEGAVLAFTDMEVHELDGRLELHVFDELEGLHSPVERGRVMVRRPGFWWVPNRGLFRTTAFRQVGGIHPNEQGEYSADWTWLLGLSLIGEFVRVPEVLCTKFYRSGSLSKTWPHDVDQVAALRRSGVAEIRRSSLPARQKTMLTGYLMRRIYGRRLPGPVKGAFRRLGL
ncbi:glycosyltransferase family 2 protein [Agromyces sp. M3QZ16-3]|uniref:glycosyltransferase family 2 protein n=1 Tax=Agromyces sp. M3QZ16-3 TaxID=3447585 RepID=UPI003F68F055